MKSVTLHKIAGGWQRAAGLIASLGRNQVAVTYDADGNLKLIGTALEIAGIIEHARDYGYRTSEIQDT